MGVLFFLSFFSIFSSPPSAHPLPWPRALGVCWNAKMANSSPAEKRREKEKKGGEKRRRKKEEKKGRRKKDTHFYQSRYLWVSFFPLLSVKIFMGVLFSLFLFPFPFSSSFFPPSFLPPFFSFVLFSFFSSYRIARPARTRWLRTARYRRPC